MKSDFFDIFTLYVETYEEECIAVKLIKQLDITMYEDLDPEFWTSKDFQGPEILGRDSEGDFRIKDKVEKWENLYVEKCGFGDKILLPICSLDIPENFLGSDSVTVGEYEVTQDKHGDGILFGCTKVSLTQMEQIADLIDCELTDKE